MDHSKGNQGVHADVGGVVDDDDDVSAAVPDKDAIQVAPPPDTRPKREHKANSKYNCQEYDLSSVSETRGGAGLALSTISIHLDAGTLRKKMTQRRVYKLFMLA